MISINGAAFRQRMQSKAANLKLGGERRIVLFAKEIHRNLVELTPKLTGKATAEWQIALGAPPSDQLLGRVRPPTEVDYEAYAQAAEGQLAAYQSGQTIYIVNNAPYINALNAGSSRQAAANFVQVAEDRALVTLRATVKVFDD